MALTPDDRSKWLFDVHFLEQPLTAGSPGVFLQQTTPGQGAAIIRGLKGSEVLHLVDGFRLNNAIFRNAPTQYLALVAPGGGHSLRKNDEDRPGVSSNSTSKATSLQHIRISIRKKVAAGSRWDS